jgi:tetratricopeptide (TPR) repeat protein
MSEYSADRENALAPANAASNCGDYERAYELYLKVLDDYPKDAHAIMIAAQAAARAGRLEDAIALYQRDLAQVTRNSRVLHTGLMGVYITLGRWQELETERIATRKASLAGDKSLSPDGYTIETLFTGKEYISVIEYPDLHGEYHTRDRFQLYEEKDPCSGFTPYIDLESDDADQAAFAKLHPDKAAGGDAAAFSLIAYTSPSSQWYLAVPVSDYASYPQAFASAPDRWLLKSYPDGEPTYQTVRADILSLTEKPLTKHHNLAERCAVTKP